MTAQGHAYTRFVRALKSGNAHLALTTAAEVQRIPLADALSLCLLLRDDDPARYDRAAVRWVALLLDRDRQLHLGDLRDLADLLGCRGRSPDSICLVGKSATSEPPLEPQ